jgi:hypothetical protein
VVSSRNLDETGIRNVLSEVPSMLDRVERVVGRVDDQGRRLRPRQEVAYVNRLCDASKRRHLRGTRHLLLTIDPELADLRIIRHARSSEVQQEPCAVPFLKLAHDTVESRTVRSPRVVIVAKRAGIRITENEARDEIRPLHRHRHTHRAANVGAQDERATNPRGGQHRNQLFRLMLDRRRNSRRKRIGAATPLNIEDHWAAKTRRPLHRSTGCRVLSEQQPRKRAEDHC